MIITNKKMAHTYISWTLVCGGLNLLSSAFFSPGCCEQRPEMINCEEKKLELLSLHLDNKGVLLWRNEPVGVKAVHSDKLLEG